MKIVIAPQGFKGNLTALEVGQAIEKGIRKVVPDVQAVIKPMADGGEGTVQALVDALGGKMMATEVTDPIGGRVVAKWGLLKDKTAVIEMAAASGLPLVPRERRNPLHTTTYGTGELIKAALDDGARKLIIGIGGSATNDGGAGMLQALGVRLADAKGKELPFGGGALAKLEHIDLCDMDPRLKDFEVILACDVNNPLCGACGASAVYGPQKGATPELVKQLDAALAHYADVVHKHLKVDLREVPGAGAAGGLGLGLMVFLKAKMIPGIDVVIEATKLMDVLKDADLVLTGEGRVDFQSVCGKVPTGVALSAKKFGIPVIALAGEMGKDYQLVFEQGIDAVMTIAPGPITLEESMKDAERLVINAAENAMRLFMAGVKSQ